MKVEIGKITNIISKINDLTSSDKMIPGVMLSVDTESKKLTVKYASVDKAFIEELDVEIEDTDSNKEMVVDFEPLTKAISNCQPSGIIKVGTVDFDLTEDKVIHISAAQYIEVKDQNGEVTGVKKYATKRMAISWVEAGSNIKTAILNRMNYDEIFESESKDVFDKKEFVDCLSKTSVEKGRNVYISANTQSVFVANQAHVTSVPVSESEMGERVTASVVIPNNIAKAMVGIFNKAQSSEVNVSRTEKWCSVYIDDGNEKIGVWFIMPKASKAHISALEMYEAKEYKTYQMTFCRELLENNIKSALNDSKSDKTTLNFVDTEMEDASSNLDLMISSGVTSVYRVNPDEIIDIYGTLKGKSFSVSLKILVDMMAQLKTDYIALDIDVDGNGVACLRLSELDMLANATEYTKARDQLALDMQARGEVFDALTTPTPPQIKLDYRLNCLVTKQYTLVGKE